MINSNRFMLLSLARPPFGAEVLEAAGADDGAAALVRLMALEVTIDFVADRLDVVTVVFAPTICVGRAETGNTGDPELRLATGYGISPLEGIGMTGVSGLGVDEPAGIALSGLRVDEPAGIGVVWISSEFPVAPGTGDVAALQYSGVVVTVTVTISAGTIQSRKLRKFKF